MGPHEPAQSLSLSLSLSLLLHVGCGERAAPTVPALADEPHAMVAPTTPTAVPEPAKRAKLVSIGRISERFFSADACEADADCVVVARHNQQELCPPGTVTNRAGFEADERWSARGFAFRPPQSGCVDPRTTLRPLCVDKRCAGEGLPAGPGDTDSEARVWKAHDKLETCQREALARGEPGVGDLVVTLAVSRPGLAASVGIAGSLPRELRTCLSRVMYGLELRQVDVVHQLRIPLELRAAAPTGPP